MKNRSIFVCVALFLISNATAMAQSACKSYGAANKKEETRKIIRLSNGNYAFSSSAWPDGPCLVVTDSDLGKLFSKSYKVQGSFHFRGLDLIESRDSGLIWTAGVEPTKWGLIKSDLNGQIVWAKEFNSSYAIYRLVQSPVSGTISAIGYRYNSNDERWEWLLARFNELGNLTSAYAIYSAQQGDEYIRASDVLRTADGGLLIGGSVTDQSGKRFGGIIKLSSFLSVHAAKRLDIPNTPYIYISALHPANDGGYLATGILELDPDIFSGLLIKFSSSYGISWAKSFQIDTKSTTPGDLTQLDDGTIVTISRVYDPVQETDKSVVVAFDANGSFKWSKNLGYLGILDPYTYEYYKPFSLLAEGDEVMVGTSTTYGQGDDIELLRLESDGNGCTACIETPDPTLSVSNISVTSESYVPTISNITSEFSVTDINPTEFSSLVLETERCQSTGLESLREEASPGITVVAMAGKTRLFNEGKETQCIAIYDVLGRMLYYGRMMPMQSLEVPLNKGIYLLKTDKHSEAQKFLVSQ